MALTKADLDQLMARVGRDNVLWSDADRIVYSSDVGSPPVLVDIMLLGGKRAGAVVRPRTADDAEAAIAYCIKRKLPMTPRAAATSALGGAVPKRGGIVIDMTALNKEITIDEQAMTVRVDAGVVIWDLQKKLLEVGLELPCYPTSGLGSTIGGFVAMDGQGIHSTRAGNISRHVTELRGVGMDGKPFCLRDTEDIQMVAGVGGATGVITSITLKVVEAKKDKPVLITVEGHEAMQAVAEEAATRFPVKHVMFHNADYFALRSEAMGERKTAFGGKDVVKLCFADSDWNKIRDDVELLAKRAGGELIEEGDKEWDLRFYPLRAKKLGPSVVAGEVYVPLARMSEYLTKLRGRVRGMSAVKELSVEGHVTNDGRVYFFIFTPDDERRGAYPLGWAVSEWILRTAKSMGGSSYASGTWLQWESKSLYGAIRYKKLKHFKRQGDPANLMNPGTTFPLTAPFPEGLRWMERLAPMPVAPSLGFQLWAGSWPLRLQGGMMPYRRHKTLGVKAADVAADMIRNPHMGLWTDDIWAADLTSLQAIPNPANLPMTQTMRGKMVLAKAYVAGMPRNMAKPWGVPQVTDPWSLKTALDTADATAEEAAMVPEYDRVLGVMDSFRRAVQEEGVELEVKAVEIVEEVVEDAGDAGGKSEGLDIEAIKEQAKNTPEAEKAWVVAADCIVCNGCESACPTDAAIVTDVARVDRDLCIADGGCFDACPTDAIRPGVEDEGSSSGWPEGSRMAGKFGV